MINENEIIYLNWINKIITEITGKIKIPIVINYEKLIYIYNYYM